jgi:hypothetical protein
VLDITPEITPHNQPTKVTEVIGLSDLKH